MHSKITLAGFEIKIYGGSLPTELSELSKIWNFRGASVQGAARARQTQKKRRRHSGREAATIFFQRAKKSNPHGGRRPGKHPTSSKRNKATKQAPKTRNEHPQRHTQTTKIKTNATKTRETTPPPQRPTRNRKARKRARTRERQNRRNTRKRRGRGEDNAEATKSRHTPAGEPSDQAQRKGSNPSNTAQREKKIKTPRRVDKGNDEAKQDDERGQRRGETREHTADQQPGATKQLQRASEQKKETTAEPAGTNPPQRATKRENAQRKHGKKRGDSKAELASRTPRTNDDAENRATDDPEHPTRETRAKSTTNRRASEGQRGTRQKPPEAPRARSGRNIYISRERWPPTHNPFRRPGTHHHTQNLSFPIP